MYRGGRKKGAWGRRTLWDRLDKTAGPEGCWPFQGGLNSKGYGTVKVKGKRLLAHRAAWILTHGPIPPEMWVLHHCDNRPCCNPAHLFLGDAAANTADMMAKGRNHWLKRTHCKYGHDLALHAKVRTKSNGQSYRSCTVCEWERNHGRRPRT